MKSRERMTVYTQVASDPEVYFEPQFVLKGKGKRKGLVNQPDHILVQWAEKGSYREQHMLKTIKKLPDRSETSNCITGQGYAVYVLDNYRLSHYLVTYLKDFFNETIRV